MYLVTCFSVSLLVCKLQESRGHIWFGIVPALVTNANYGVGCLRHQRLKWPKDHAGRFHT